MEQQMKDDIKKNKNGFSDPNAAIGFTRGVGGVQDPRDAMQEAFQKKEEKGNSSGDMPDVSPSRRARCELRKLCRRSLVLEEVEWRTRYLASVATFCLVF
jgi:hypothetical protein